MTLRDDTHGKRIGGLMLHLDGLEATSTARTLAPLDLGGTGERHLEAWLQDAVQRFPQILPAREIEPGFGALIPVCTELPVPKGYVDNLFVTPDGDLTVVECKLWRNPQARREVVGQIIEYAECLASWSYEELERKVAVARKGAGEPAQSLYELVSEHDPLPEAAFVDAVARNLRLGRFLLLVVGDGIHESAETLAEYLQMHAGFHFTLALVQAQVHPLPTGGYVVQPRVLARTVNIERGIVRIEDARAGIAPIAAAAAVAKAAPGGERRTNISEERLFEALAGIDPALPDRLRAFADSMAEDGVTLDAATKSLVLRWSDGVGRKLNLGAINPEGVFMTEYSNWDPDSNGHLEIAHAYQRAAAAAVSGVVHETRTPGSWYVAIDGKRKPSIIEMLAHEEAWRRAILAFIESYSEALREDD